MKPITTEAKIKEVKAEISMREHVYGNKVKSGTMTKELSEFKIAVMKAILADYEAQVVTVSANQTSLF